MSTPRAVLVLLGAGASAEAGVPLTVDMTEQIVRRVNDGRDHHARETAEALNFVASALIGFEGGKGRNPYEGVDVEKLFSAVELLAARNDHEATPFVASWLRAVDAMDRPRVRYGWGDDFLRAMLGDDRFGSARTFRRPFGRDIEAKLVALIQSAVGAGTGSTYKGVLECITSTLRELVAIDAPDKTAYLDPLFAIGKDDLLGVATLNYDRSVEMSGARLGLDVDTGIESWVASGALGWRSDAVHLMKLHGSIDWAFSEPGYEKGHLPMRSVVTGSAASERRDPAIVFGGRGKLRSEGPFLDLLRAFAERLQAADDLLVVGYSFRDDHVNEYVGRWLNADAQRVLTIIDPGFPERVYGGDRDFRSELVRYLLHTSPDESEDGRLRALRVDTSEGLPLFVEAIR